MCVDDGGCRWVQERSLQPARQIYSASIRLALVLIGQSVLLVISAHERPPCLVCPPKLLCGVLV